MKRILYLSNIEVPYRVRFFNELAIYCDLTVLYERRQSKNRDKTWTASEPCRYRSEYLKGINISNENAFSLEILKFITGKYDAIIVGCYNSPIQATAILLMKLLGISYYLNIDGEIYLGSSSLKNLLKHLILRGAAKYIVAGEKAAFSLASIAADVPVIPYYFSSLSEEELVRHEAESQRDRRDDIVLVIGQYFDYKGMDIALKAAKMDQSIQYKFVGMGKRTDLFREAYKTDEIENVEIIPFLQREELEKLYKSCAMLVLPSRQECWGLVVNEAASFGMPIVSTWGSGAAVEFIGENYPQYLARPGDPADLLKCIRQLQTSTDATSYRAYLLKKNRKYSIEKSVQVHLHALDIL